MRVEINNYNFNFNFFYNMSERAFKRASGGGNIMSNQMSELDLYNPQFEKGKTLKNLEKTIDFLETREKFTFEIKDITELAIIDRGVQMALDVVEVDEHLKSNGGSREEVKFFISRKVFSHLASYLKIPTTMYDFYQRFLQLERPDFDACCEKEGEILQVLFRDRYKAGDKTDFITAFKDGFGFYPRVIHSKVYFPYRDDLALNKMVSGFKSINARSELDYYFYKAFITPYKTSLYFNDRHSTIVPKDQAHVGDIIEAGLCIQNSECKEASFNFRTSVIKLICDNGNVSAFNRDLSVRHYERNFERQIQLAFTEALKLTDQHAKKYLDAINYNNEISDDWADLIEVPKKYLAMKPNEKHEIAEIGRQQGYEFSPNGIIQAITYKSSNRVYDDNNFERLNTKVNNIIDLAPELSKWKPERLRALA